MHKSARILIMEDYQPDAEMAMREIRKSLTDCVFQCVTTEQEYLEALENFEPDLILADYHLPHFTGLQAMKLALERQPLMPVIIITGSQSEDVAVDCMRAGAANYIIKENIKRLGTAVVHALEEKKVRIERRQAEERLRESEAKYRTLIESSNSVIATLDAAGRYHFINRIGALHLGREPSEVIGRRMKEFFPAEDIKYELQSIQKVIESDAGVNYENAIVVNGRKRWYSNNIQPVRDVSGHPVLAMVNAQDITERKLAEERIRRQIKILTALQEIDRAIIGSFDLSLNLNFLLARALSILAADAAAVWLLHPGLGMLECISSLGFQGRAIRDAGFRPYDGPAGRAALGRSLVQISNLVEEPDNQYLAALLEEERFTGYYGVPLIVKGEVVGVMEVLQRSQIERDREWLDILDTLADLAALAIDNAGMFEGLQRSNLELMVAYDATIVGWSRAMELRDECTEGHTQRVTELTEKLATRMGRGPQELVHIRRGALLHDIGKLGVPDSILLKSDPLTEEEWEVMRRHPVYAREMLSQIAYLKPAMDIPYCHHERWDGTGYPQGLKYEHIPEAARIFAVVDVWDAVTSYRPYRSGWSTPQAMEYIRQQSEKLFDPRVVEAFLSLMAEAG